MSTATRVAGFVARRLAVAAALLVVVSFLVFSMLHLAPGDPVDALLGNLPRTPEAVAALRAQHHLDEPFLTQYGRWVAAALQLDLGTSITAKRPVGEIMGERLALTLFLGLYAFVVAVAVGGPLAVLAAVHRRSALDRAVVGFAVAGLSTPAFVTGIFLLYVFAVQLGWLPAYGAGESFTDRIVHLTLPAMALAFAVLGLVVKFTRTALIGALDQDYVSFAIARGVPMSRVLVHHALRNALIPVVTALGLVLMGVLTGSVLVEVTFSLSGLGDLLVTSVNSKDVPVVQAVALLVAVIVVAVSLLVDLLYLVVDPRVRRGVLAR